MVLACLRRLADSRFVVLLCGPWGTAFDDPAGMVGPTGPSSWSVAIGEDLPDEFLEAFVLLFLAVWRGPVLPLLTTL
jgi:hypothetical protein